MSLSLCQCGNLLCLAPVETFKAQDDRLLPLWDIFDQAWDRGEADEEALLPIEDGTVEDGGPAPVVAEPPGETTLATSDEYGDPGSPAPEASSPKPSPVVEVPESPPPLQCEMSGNPSAKGQAQAGCSSSPPAPLQKRELVAKLAQVRRGAQKGTQKIAE